MGRVFSIFLSLLLLGCGVVNSDRVPCPKTAIIAEFSKTLEIYDGIPIQTDLDSLIPECTQEGPTKNVRFRLRMTSFRPLRNFQKAVTITPSYFIAIVDKEGNVISRSEHDIEIIFEERQTTKVSFINVEEQVSAGKDLGIYVGFILDEIQQQHLQKKREKNFITSPAL